MNLMRKCNCFTDNKVYDLEMLNNIKEQNPNSSTLNHLSCPYCKCKLEFHRKTDRRRAFLSTWPKEKHSKNCRFYFEYENRSSSSSYNTVDSYLSEKEIKAKVKYMYDKMHKKNITKHSKDDVKDNKRKNPKKSQTTSTTHKTTTMGSVKSSDIHSNGTSGSRMIYREPGGITLKDAGKSIVLGGILKKVSITKTSTGISHAILYITNNSGKTEKVYTAPSYFYQDIEGLEDRIIALDDIISNLSSGQEFICLINAAPDESGEIQLNLYEERHMFFPKMPISIYISLQSKRINTLV